MRSRAILALPAGFHTMTTKIWSLFQFPPKPELAAATSIPLLLLTVALLRSQAAVLKHADSLQGDEATGARMVAKSLEAPLKQIAEDDLLGCHTLLLGQQCGEPRRPVGVKPHHPRHMGLGRVELVAAGPGVRQVGPDQHQVAIAIVPDMVADEALAH